MTETKLKALVAEAVFLDRQKAEIDKRIKKIKTQLIAEAESRPDEHTETDGGGSSVRFDGADGCIAVVSFPARTLKSKIDGEGKIFERIEALAGSALDRLFTPSVVYKPSTYFRQEAMSIIGGAEGARLIRLCETETTPRVSFETADKKDIAAL